MSIGHIRESARVFSSKAALQAAYPGAIFHGDALPEIGPKVKIEPSAQIHCAPGTRTVITGKSFIAGTAVIHAGSYIEDSEIRGTVGQPPKTPRTHKVLDPHQVHASLDKCQIAAGAEFLCGH